MKTFDQVQNLGSSLFDCPSGPYGLAGGVPDLSEDESRAQEEVRERHLLTEPFEMKRPGEAIFFYDRELKHEVRHALVRERLDQIGKRRTLLAFARRPDRSPEDWFKLKGGVSYADAAKEFHSTGCLASLFEEFKEDFDAKSALYWQQVCKMQSMQRRHQRPEDEQIP